MIRILFATGVLAVVSIVEIGRTPAPTQSVTSGVLTVNYTDDVPEKRLPRPLESCPSQEHLLKASTKSR